MSRFTLRFFNLIQTTGQDLSLTIPICNVYAPIIDRAFPQIAHIGWRKTKAAQGNCYTYIKQITAADLTRLQEFLKLLQGLWVLTLTDHLKPYFKKDLSEAYALDFNFNREWSRSNTRASDHWSAKPRKRTVRQRFESWRGV